MSHSNYDTPKYIYPMLEDPDFNIKIANKKEFQDTKYHGVVAPIEQRATLLQNMPFEVSSHQLFVKSFMSFQTPYNSLLLYHGLGTGKTCSAIGVAEDMRQYLKKFQVNKSIIIVASPNVQSNFKLQLFDESKLVEKNGEWFFQGCVGNSIINEINPIGIKNYPRDKVIQQIKAVIKKNYTFMGYIQLANIIRSLSQDIKKLKKEFNGRLVIIDEYHNMRTAFDSEDARAQKKETTKQLDILVENADNLRLLLLSATPMYNSHKEIIWTLNLLNKNDKRPLIREKDIFTKNGDFTENGKQRLIEAARGYISFVKGDNPYVFPFRVYPQRENKNFQIIDPDDFPTTQLNDLEIPEEDRLQVLSGQLTGVKIMKKQYNRYQYILDNTIGQSENFESLTGFTYTDLQLPLQGLNITYPANINEGDVSPNSLVGTEGLSRVVRYTNTSSKKGDFEYIEGQEGFFHPDRIINYSCKIERICREVANSNGVVLIYSNYLDGGLIPMALALEEMGISRFGQNKSLFATAPTKYTGMTYAMITGDKRISPNNSEEVFAATNMINRNGSIIKVILITAAGAEGIDLKFIRQVHVMEPWYNINRIEQIIGRAVRNFSHKDLPFEQRNVQIFLYATLLRKEKKDIEALDMYIYRLAEKKALKIGRVTRALKESAVDCLLNYEQNNYTHLNLRNNKLGHVRQVLSNGDEIERFRIGDMPYSVNCDYMEMCEYVCTPYTSKDEYVVELDEETYDEHFIKMNTTSLQTNIAKLFTHGYIYNYETLYRELLRGRKYNDTQIYYALTKMINNKIQIADKYGRPGTIVNVGEYYLFQPVEINYNKIGLFERRTPVSYKRDKLNIDLNEKYLRKINKPVTMIVDEVMDEDEDFGITIEPKKPIVPSMEKGEISLQKAPPKTTTQKKKTTIKIDDEEDYVEDIPVKEEKKKSVSFIQPPPTSQQYVEEISPRLIEYLTTSYKKILSYAKDPTQIINKEDEYDFSRFLGQASNILPSIFPGTKVTDFVILAVQCIIDVIPLESKIQLLQMSLGENKGLKDNMFRILQEYMFRSLIDMDGTKIAVFYQWMPLDKKFAMIPKTIRGNRLDPGVSYDTQVAITEHIQSGKQSSQRMNNILGFITYDPKKNHNYFKIIELDKKRNTGSFCHQKTKKDVVTIIERVLPTELIEILDQNVIYSKMKKEQLCALLIMVMKHMNKQNPSKIWYLTLEEYQGIYGK